MITLKWSSTARGTTLPQADDQTHGELEMDGLGDQLSSYRGGERRREEEGGGRTWRAVEEVEVVVVWSFILICPPATVSNGPIHCVGLAIFRTCEDTGYVHGNLVVVMSLTCFVVPDLIKPGSGRLEAGSGSRKLPQEQASGSPSCRKVILRELRRQEEDIPSFTSGVWSLDRDGRLILSISAFEACIETS
jgi:hypothetical protein